MIIKAHMKAQLTAIFADDSHWRIALSRGGAAPQLMQVPTEPGVSAGERAAALRRLLNERHAKPGVPVLALPSRWCLPGVVDTTGLLRRGQRAALIYRLEEKLPLDAEQLAADFIERRGSALGIAVEVQPIVDILNALEAQDIRVGAIAPLALLALEQWRIQRRDTHADLVLIQTPSGVDVIQLDEHHPAAWHHLPLESTALQRELTRLTLDRHDTLRIATIGLSDDLKETAQRHERVELIDADDAQPCELAAQRARAIAIGGEAASVNLRRNALAPKDRLQQVKRPLQAAACALILLIAAIGGVTLRRGIQYQQLTAQLQQRQIDLFQDAFPGQDAPVAVASRLHSELRQQRGLRGPGNVSGRHDPFEQASALRMLRAALEGLPTNLRYRVLELRLDSAGLYLDGQARSHGDAEQVAAGLRGTGLWQIHPPRTEQLKDRGVAFMLTGDLNASAPAGFDPSNKPASAAARAGGGP